MNTVTQYFSFASTLTVERRSIKNNPKHFSKLLISGPRFDSFGECSNPCKSNPDIEATLSLPQGIRVSECRWNENGPCVDLTESCHGSRDWVVQDSGESDPEKCIFVT